MRIRVDFYKQTGKWYAGDEVEIGDARLWMGEQFRQAIVDNQHILFDGWQDDDYFYVVTSDLPEYDDDPNYTAFSCALLTPDKFAGMKRNEVI
jgi:hypothetical protein